MSIAENIKKLREYYNLSQKELAEIAGVTNKAVSTWETGNNEPRMGAIQKISEHFHIKKSDIIEDFGWKSFYGINNENNNDDKLQNLSPENREKALEYIHLLNMLENKQAIEKDNNLDFRKEAWALH